MSSAWQSLPHTIGRNFMKKITHTPLLCRKSYYLSITYKTPWFLIFKNKLWLLQYIESTTILYSTLQTAHLYTTHNNMMYMQRSNTMIYILLRRRHDLYTTWKVPWCRLYWKSPIIFMLRSEKPWFVHNVNWVEFEEFFVIRCLLTERQLKNEWLNQCLRSHL